MANLPVLRSLPDDAVEVIYDGELGNAWYWIIHIEPSGVFWLHRFSTNSLTLQYLRQDILEFDFSRSGFASVNEFADAIMASVDIEGLTKAESLQPVGRVRNLSAIGYRIVPVSE